MYIQSERDLSIAGMYVYTNLSDAAVVMFRLSSVVKSLLVLFDSTLGISILDLSWVYLGSILGLSWVYISPQRGVARGVDPPPRRVSMRIDLFSILSFCACVVLLWLALSLATMCLLSQLKLQNRPKSGFTLTD